MFSLLRNRWLIFKHETFSFVFRPVKGYNEIYIGFNVRKWKNCFECIYVYYYVICHKLLKNAWKVLEFDCRRGEGTLMIDVLSISNSNRCLESSGIWTIFRLWAGDTHTENVKLACQSEEILVERESSKQNHRAVSSAGGGLFICGVGEERVCRQ